MTVMENDHAQVKVPPPALMLLFILAAFGLDHLFPLPIAGAWLIWMGVILVGGGLFLAFLAVYRLHAAGTTIEPHGTVTALVTDGPYHISRNPIYLAYVWITVGFPMALGTLWGLVMAPLLILSLNYFVIRYEEEYLGKKFGGGYDAYKLKVRRWL